jgi:hypothetical protein
MADDCALALNPAKAITAISAIDLKKVFIVLRVFEVNTHFKGKSSINFIKKAVS